MNENLSDIKDKFQLAKRLIRQAGVYIRKNMDKDLIIEEKTCATDLVTDLDKSVQNLVVDEIKRAYPSDSFLAEEEDLKCRISDPRVWVLDPIDGTANFVAQRDNFTILLSYYESGVGKFGLILDVMADNLYYGDGHKVFKNDQEIKTRILEKSRSFIGVNSYMYRTNEFGLADLAEEFLGVRMYGGAGIDYVNLIEGKLYGYFSNLCPWDYSAGTIILSAFGYETRPLDGSELNYCKRQKVMTVPKDFSY